ncbi:MAG: sensor-like histidine kinase [Anaerolineaceae bacterium]|nr:MAG: sensor-like histidine kinase [Anaerolineaceae bacterium]
MAAKKHPEPSDRRLRGAWLWLVRIGFALLALMALGLFAAGVPVELSRLRGNILALEIRADEAGHLLLYPQTGGLAEDAGIQPGDVLVSVDGQPVPAGTTPAGAWKLLDGGEGETVTLGVARQADGPARRVVLLRPAAYEKALARMNLSPGFMAGYMTAFHILFVAGFTLVAALVFWRKSDDWMAAGLALTLVMFVVRSAPEMYFADDVYPWLRVPVAATGLLGVVLPVWLLYLFPNGKFAPRWTLWPALAATLWYAAFFLPAAVNPIRLPPVVIFLMAMAFYGIGVGAQIYRYRRVSTLTERQQTKWAVLGFAGALVISYLLLIPLNRLPVFELTASGLIWSMLLNRPLYYLGLLLVPVTLAVSMLRRGLWDVDVVINRAAVYTLLLGLLGLIWTAGTALLDEILGSFLEARSQTLSVALSGVGSATLFLPLKKRIETWINARFYPDRVDFEAALVELRPDVVDGIALPDLYHALVTTVPALLQCRHAAVFEYEAGSPRVKELCNLAAKSARLELKKELADSLRCGKVLHRPADDRFPVIVPLFVPRGRTCDLLGLLALGARAGGRGFSRDHLSGLAALGARAGTAIHIIELNEKKEIALRKRARA